MSNAMTPDQNEARLAKRRAMTDLLLGVLPTDVPHSVILEARLTVYIAVAETHPCCTLAASSALLIASGRLQATASDRPAGTHVH